MNKISLRVSNYVLFLIVLTLFCIPSLKSAYSQYACIPTCSEVDGKMLLLVAGATLQTINNQNVEVQIVSPQDSDTVEIGIFDGDDLQVGDFSRWDRTSGRPPVMLQYRLILDPEGDGSGNGLTYLIWTSDGSFGENVGSPLPDGEWFTQVVQNAPGAQTANGSYSYRLEVSVFDPDPNPAGEAWNAFKLRTDGIISILAGSAFNYMVPQDNFLDIIDVYPDIDFFDPACIGPGNPLSGYCDPDDPSCCLFNTNYDGRWEFCMLVPDGLNTLDIWDGDFDFGSSSPNAVDPFICDAPDGISLDTDDPNTPIALPPWSIGTDVVTQSASVPTAPPDDNGCFGLFLRRPSVNYNLIGPNGEFYTNVNPSGNLEWELFNISTNPFNPVLYDIHVSSIEPGLWCIETVGNDLRNLNSFRLPYDLFGVDENDNPVLPPEGPDSTSVPTLNEWGLITLSAFVLLISIYYLRFRERKVIK